MVVGNVTRLAGGGIYDTLSGATDGLGTAALFYYPYGIAVSMSGTVYVADTINHLIRMISPTGITSSKIINMSCVLFSLPMMLLLL